ncbi:MAG: ABC transporter substrate-binding protein [Anaerolineae bacterium]|jgi:ABC-type transport system substrate-binding protein|nr:ABC transporter substrate-binding protein [Anaerolineae bacterium]
MKRALRVLSVSLLLVVALGALFPVAAQDLLSQQAECGAANNTSNFQSIEAVDATTVRFTLCNPDPAFLSKVAFSSLSILPSEYLETTGGGGDLIQNPVGTGPYRLERWDLGNEMVFSRFDGYWGDAAKEATVIFRWNTESTARVTELQSGNVDGIDNPGEADFAVIEANPDLALYPRGGTNVFYIGMNNTIEPFNSLEVRQAIAYAIDRQRIVDNFYPPGSIPATQFMPPSLFGFTPEVQPLDAGLSAAEKVARAQELLAAAGLPDGFEVTLNIRDVVRGYLPDPKVVAADIQTQLAAVGITVNIEIMESGAFLDASDAGELAFYLLGWGMDYPDPTNFLDFHFGAGASAQFGDKIPELTEILAEAGSTADTDARYALYTTANEILRDQVPMLAVAHGGSAAAFAARVAGAYSSDVGAEQFALMEDPDDDNIVWMQNAEPIGLYCADETDGETLRACEQVYQSLLRYEIGTGTPIAALATEWTFNEELTEWTFTLREGVQFHDGSTLDANDVVLSYLVQWDAAHPLHVGRDGNFTYFSAYFGGFLNPPPAQ